MKRRISVLAAALAVALAGAVYALAGHGVGSVPSFTGCIKEGKLVKLKPGDEPKAPCVAGEVEAHLSGGDVTAVLAGTGLVGGGAEGSLVLRADPAVVQSRVTGWCVDVPGIADGSISRISQDGTVECNEDDGFVDYRRITVTSPSNSSSPKDVRAECPGGTRIVGGGANVGGDGNLVDLRSSGPYEDPERWRAVAAEVQPTGLPWQVSATAFCAVVD